MVTHDLTSAKDKVRLTRLRRKPRVDCRRSCLTTAPRDLYVVRRVLKLRAMHFLSSPALVCGFANHFFLQRRSPTGITRNMMQAVVSINCS